MTTTDMFDKNSVQSELTLAADQVEKTDSYAAKRLRDLAQAVNGGHHSDAWAANDIHQIIDVDKIVARYQVQTRLDLLITILELIRNVLIFLPLVITWWGISQAMTAYSSLNSTQTQLPFILLWEHGFGDKLPSSLYFSSVAWDDVIILTIMLALTFITLLLSNIVRQNRDNKAQALGQRITHALASARLCLTTKNWQQPTNFVTRFDQAIESFKEMTREMVEQMRDERQAISLLADRQSAETKLFSDFKSDFTTNMGRMSHALSNLQDASSKLSDSIDSKLTKTMIAVSDAVGALTQPTQELAISQGEISKSNKETNRLLDMQVKTHDEIVRQQDQWGQNLRNALTILEKTVTQTTGQNSEFADRVNEINKQYLNYLNEMKQEYSTQKDITNRIFDITQQMEKTVTLIKESSNELSAINVNLEGVARIVTGITSTATVR